MGRTRLVKGEKEVVIRMGESRRKEGVWKRKYGGREEEGRKKGIEGGRREMNEEKRKRREGERREMNKENRKRGGEKEVEDRYMKRKGREEEEERMTIGGSQTGRCWRGHQWALWQCPGFNSRHL